MTGAPLPFVVAIDGPAGVGKSTIARRLADDLGWAYLDTGAMYRLVTLAARARGVPADDEGALVAVARGLQADFTTAGRVVLEGRDVTAALRGPEVTAAVARVAAWPGVRREVVAWQRAFARRAGRVVAEGRDTGTVVFPRAAVKVFLDGDPAERARRRLAQEGGAADGEDLDRTRAALEARDAQDRTRATSPLRPAEDAWRLDTTHLTVEQVFAAVRSHVRSGIPVASGDESAAQDP